VRAIAERLERGAFDGPFARALESVWARAAEPRLVKRLTWPKGARVVAIGGATLGGSGKTPLAIACARALEAAGVRAAIVGHAYRASPGAPRVVRPDDPLARVGDEALVCARAGLRVTVARTRQAALDLALRVADVALLDGVHQCAPQKASLAILAVDPEAPWGAGACPPRGDLRAPRSALEGLADLVVKVRARSRGAWRRGALVPWSDIARARVGLVTALARPERVLRLLASHQVVPRAIRTFPDHGRPRLPKLDVDLWLATPKCAAALAEETCVIDHEPLLDPTAWDALRLMLDHAPSGSYPRKHQVKRFETWS
jgi:tetraacyldisaccharide 4'-kinase